MKKAEVGKREAGKIKMKKKKDITIIGNSVIDILAGPVREKAFQSGSQSVNGIKFSYGGDALNEAVILSRFGQKVELVSKIGKDESGSRILNFIEKNGILSDSIIVDPQIDTSVNIVLVDEKGERCFLTDPKGSQRKLSAEDVWSYLESAADLVSFASIFVSPLLDAAAMTKIFRKLKEKPGRIVAADMTKAKKGERLEDLRGFLPYIDYILPNSEEIALLTGNPDPYANAELLVEAGVHCAVIKCGKKGCLIKTQKESYHIPAYPVEKCIDTTGAGDCFAAGFLWALSQGMTLEECGKFACAAASCTVEYMGAAEGISSLEKPLSRYEEMRRKIFHFEGKRGILLEREGRRNVLQNMNKL